MPSTMVQGYQCSRCGHTWAPQNLPGERPRVCPKCKSPYWDSSPGTLITKTKRFKPTRTPIANALARQKEWGWAIVAGVFEVALASDQGSEYWCCGNPNCSTPLRVSFGLTPKVCAKCGGEVDWVGIKTRVIKVCPRCNRQAFGEDTYCAFCTPATILESREVPI